MNLNASAPSDQSNVLPLKNHNLLFSRITDLVKLVKNKKEELINNKDIKQFSISSLDTKNIAQKVNSCQRNESDFDLKRIIFKTNGYLYFKGIFYNLSHYLSGCLGIYFLDLLTEDLKSTNFSEQQKKNDFIFKIIMVFICFAIKTVLYQQSEWVMYCHDSKQQSLMQYLIFKKSLKTIQYYDSRDAINQGDISNLLTTDSRESIYVFYGIVELITGQIALYVIFYFLYLKLKSAIFYGLIFLIFSLLVNVYLQNLINKYFDLEQSWTDQRLSLTKDVVEGMKSIKYLGWENIFLNKIYNLRKGEFSYTKKTRYVGALTGVIWICLGYVLLYVFLMTYAWQGNDIQNQNIFTIIALFGYLKYPLGNVPYAVSYFLKSLVSLKRIQTFLNQKEISQLEYEIKENDKSKQFAIQINNTVFFWPTLAQDKPKKDKNNDLQEVNELDNFIEQSEVFNLQISKLKIKKGSLNFVIGEIGSGKTALLLGILNELSNKELDIEKKKTKKRILINGSIGYVSANHWLQSRTIRENILFGEQYDSYWYQTCVSACKLDEDFNQFEKKDLKIIGPGGSNLSGGQRQRIALCRALYSKKNIYLFDDIFSSLDVHVAKQIFEQVIQKLLIQNLQSTVLFVTSHYAFISQNLNNNNFNIILIKNNKLSSSQQEINEYLSHSQAHSNKLSSHHHTHQINNINNNDQNYTQNTEDQQEQIQDKVYEFGKGEKEDNNEEEEQNLDDRQKGGIKISTLILFFRSRGFLITTLHILFSFITQASQMIIDFWLRDFSEGQESSEIVVGLNQFFSGFNQIFQALTLINLIIALLCGLFYAISAIKCSSIIFEKLNNSIIFSKLTFFDQNPVGRIISRISTDQNQVDDVLQWHFHVLLEKLAYLIGYPVGMIIQMPLISIHFAVIMFLAYLISLIYRETNRELKRLNQSNESQLLTVLGENSKGITLIRGMQKNEYMMNDFISQIDKFISTQIVSNALSIWFILRLFILSNSSFLFVVIWNIYYILNNDEVNNNTIALGLIYSMLFSTVFSDVMNFYSYFEIDILSIERISQYFNNQQEKLHERPKESSYSIVDNKIIEDTQQEDYSISFSNVYLKYEQNNLINDNQQQDQDKFALRNVTFKIKKGEKIAFCGRTGSGKTSILNVLFKLYDIQSGNICVNQQDITQQSLFNLRRQMSIIPQYGFLFNGSLHENLDPIGALSQKQILDVLNNFQSLQIKKQDNKNNNKNVIENNNREEQEEKSEISLSSEESILDMEIQEGGKNLSNGEKQIINFFRIVFRDSNIICLDEATSNMDPKTDKELHQELFKFSENKTLIVITHRLENIDMYDRVFVMDQGQIVESGHVSQLKKNPNGFFNSLQSSS